MFTGLIEGLGTISRIRPAGRGKRLTIEAHYSLETTKIGDSIAVNGICLTVVNISDKRFEVDISPETLKSTTLDRAKPGDRLNLERALRLSDRIDGHLVSGHVDGIGVIKKLEKLGNAVIVTIAVPQACSRYMIHKGSVAVDGVSLTINFCDADSFTVSIIPHTADITTIGSKRIGDPVNIETDMIGKYIERFIRGDSLSGGENSTAPSGLTMESLAKSGFL